MKFAPVVSREFDRLTKDPLARVALAVVALVPLLYGALYLWAFWDPYAQVDRLPVALVVLDQPSRVGDETLAAGRDLADELVTKRSFEWHRVSADQAARGLSDGTYYMTLTIPSDFSADLASADDAHPQAARILVARREGANYLASQIGSRVFSEIRAAASASASKRYVDSMLVGFTDAHGSLNDAALGASDLAEGLETARDGADRLAEGAGAAHAGAMELSAGVTALSGGLRKLDGGARKLSAGASSLSAGLSRAAVGSQSAAAGASSLAQGSESLSSGLEDATMGSTVLASGSAALASSSSKLSDGIGQLSQAGSALSEGAGALSSGADGVSDGAKAAASGLGEAASASGRLAQGAAGLNDILDELADAHPELAGDATLSQARAAASQVKSGSSDLAARLDGAAGSTAKLAAGAESLAANAHKVESGIDALATGLKASAEGSSKLASGAGSVAEGATALKTGVTRASAGSAALASGATQLAQGADELARGVSSAASGGRSVAKGAADLASGAARLKSGGSAAAKGARDLSGGIGQLERGTRSLQRGLEPAAQGSRELAQGLTAGVDELPAYSAASRTRHARMMSNPVELENTTVNAVPNYGSGFAPYFIPLSLWVGALVCFLFVSPLPEAHAGESPLRRAFAGWTAASLVGAAQAALLLTVVFVGLGLAATDPAGVWAVVIVTALVFAAIQQLLNAAFGPAGKFLAIVLLMLQLTSAAGTFPVEMQPAFFQTLHPYLPMTYAVSGLRTAISGGPDGMLLTSIGALVAFGVAALTLTCAIALRGGSPLADTLSASIDI